MGLRITRKVIYKYKSRILSDVIFESKVNNEVHRLGILRFIIRLMKDCNDLLTDKFISEVKKNDLTDDDINKMLGFNPLDNKSVLYKYYTKNIFNYEYQNPHVYTVRRDNKDFPNKGSGGCHGNYIRYPSKKRSVRVWRNFYKLFPWLAEKDKWNGKTSERYNNGNNRHKRHT